MRGTPCHAFGHARLAAAREILPRGRRRQDLPGCRVIMLYWDDVPHVEVGVELLVPCPLTGRVVASALPTGQVAMTVHHGPYSGLGAAHRAVIDWCAVQEKQRVGTRWEVYGPHNDDPAKVWTEVYYLLA